jgi:hypothetical protein
MYPPVNEVAAEGPFVEGNSRYVVMDASSASSCRSR